MSSKNFWLVENQVMCSYPVGYVTLNDLINDNKSILEMLREGEANGIEKIHLFVNTSELKHQPSPLDTRKAFTFMENPHLGWVVIGGNGNPLFRFFTKVVTSIAGSRTRIFDTPEQALTFLTYKEPDLPNLVEIFRGKVR